MVRVGVSPELAGRLEVAASIRNYRRKSRCRPSVAEFLHDLLIEEDAEAAALWEQVNDPGFTEVGKQPVLRGRKR